MIEFGKFWNWTSNVTRRIRKSSSESQCSTSTATSTVPTLAGTGFECVAEEVASGLEIEIWVKNNKKHCEAVPELRRAISCPAKSVCSNQEKVLN